MSFCVSFFSVAPFAPLLKYTCYMCNRQGAHKSDRISSSLCSHDNALLYLYWYLHFMLIWPWCILSYVWWEAIKLFWILNLESLNLWIFSQWWPREKVETFSFSICFLTIRNNHMHAGLNIYITNREENEELFCANVECEIRWYQKSWYRWLSARLQ